MGKCGGKKCRLMSMLWLTTAFFVVEIVVGYITNSMALVADSFHMLSDVAALIVAFLSVKVSTYLKYMIRFGSSALISIILISFIGFRCPRYMHYIVVFYFPQYCVYQA